MTDKIEYIENENYLPPIYEVSNDPEGYITSFSVEQESEYIEFFNKFGFVVIRDILNKKECQNTINDIWDYIESFKWTSHYSSLKDEDKTIKRNDPSTWNKVWPNLSAEGIVGYPPVFTPTTIENRSNPKIYNIYSNLLNRKDLYINHDRFGFFRPTKNVLLKFPNITPTNDEIKLLSPTSPTSPTTTPSITSNFENWKTVKNLHLDLNPFSFIEDKEEKNRKKIFSTLSYRNSSNVGSEDFFIENNQPGYIENNELHIQALINLCDNKEEDGGFLVLPGFHLHIKDWILSQNEETAKKKYGYHSNFICIPPENKLLYDRAIRVTARHGSIILFNQRLLHGSAPNNSEIPRMAMFLKMFPSSQLPKEQMLKRLNSINECFEKQNGFKIQTNNLTDIQKKVLGLELW